MTDTFETLIEHWKADPGSTYQTWFLWGDRLKNFRSIRRGITQVAQDIHAGTFGNCYRGSTLETVVSSIAEQRQIFKGADHAFLWKPKLRIPDIYEHADNQKAFARLLHACNCCDTAEQVIAEIQRIDALKIKGLGPATANLLYFIHPTLITPFNTAIVNGFNAATGSKVKLGRWDHYLTMRTSLLALNQRFRTLLSNDLGAIAGLMFDLGQQRYPAPPLHPGANATAAWMQALAQVQSDAQSALKQKLIIQKQDASHTDMQGWLRDLGLALGFQVWIAANDRSREFNGSPLSDGCLQTLPDALTNGLDSVRLIDVIWLESSGALAAAFEVEHSTSIYSGIVRMLDLAFSGANAAHGKLFLVAPDHRHPEVAAQLRRPAFSRAAELDIRYLQYSALKEHRFPMARFGSGIKPLLEIALRC